MAMTDNDLPIQAQLRNPTLKHKLKILNATTNLKNRSNYNTINQK